MITRREANLGLLASAAGSGKRPRLGSGVAGRTCRRHGAEAASH
jgi:hypothetical protein